jgi:hypothetical protein
MTEIIGDKLIIEREKDQICSLCGKMAETRPYGKGGSEICYECGHLPANIEFTTKRMYE